MNKPVPSVAWLVELQTYGQPLWLQADVDDNYGWTLDPNKAIRFARKQDADWARQRWGFTATAPACAHLSTEHIWLNADD